MERPFVVLDAHAGLVQLSAGPNTETHPHIRSEDKAQRRRWRIPRSCVSRRPRSTHIGGCTGNASVPLLKESGRTFDERFPRSAPTSANDKAPLARWRRQVPPGSQATNESDKDSDVKWNADRMSHCPCTSCTLQPEPPWSSHTARAGQLSVPAGKSRSSLRQEVSDKAYASVCRLRAKVDKKDTRSLKRDVPGRHLSCSSLALSIRARRSSPLKAYESAACRNFFSGYMRSNDSCFSTDIRTDDSDREGHVNTRQRLNPPVRLSSRRAVPMHAKNHGAQSPVRRPSNSQAGSTSSTERAASAPSAPVHTTSCWQVKRPVKRAHTQEDLNSSSTSVASAPVVNTTEDEEASWFRSIKEGTPAGPADLEFILLQDEYLNESDLYEPLYATQKEYVNLSLEHFDNPETFGDLPPQEWARRCAARRKPPCSPNTAKHPNEVCSMRKYPEEKAIRRESPTEEAALACVVSAEASGTPSTTRVPRQRYRRFSENKAHSAADTTPDESEEDAYVCNYESGGWRWAKCRVLRYLETEKRFQVRLLDNGHEKQVSRPALRFVEEDQKQAEQRVEMCRRIKEQMRLRQSLINTIRLLPDKEFQQMPSQTQERLLRKMLVRFGTSAERYQRAKLSRQLLWQLKDLYTFAMKFAFIKHKAITLNGTPYAYLSAKVKTEYRFGRLFEALVPPPIKECGCLTLPDATRPFAQTTAMLEKSMQFHRACISQVLLKVHNRFFDISGFRFLDIHQGRNRKQFRLGLHSQPNLHTTKSDPVGCTLEDFIRHQREHCCDVKDALAEQWREFVQNEIMATVGAMGKSCLFYTDDLEKHLNGTLHRVLRKIHLMMSHQMEEFVAASIEDWKQFLLSFMNDDRHNLPEPLLAVAVTLTGNKVSLAPSPNEIREKVSSLLDWLVDQANSIVGIEKSLFPFINIPQLPLFAISRDYRPLVEMKACMKEVLNRCLASVDPLLSRFRHIEETLTECTSDMQLGTSSVARIRERMEKIHEVLYTVRSIPAAEVKFRLFAVNCAAAVKALSTRAEDLWQKTCDTLSRHVADEVSKLTASWQDLHARILSIPADEAELSALKHLIGTLNEHTDPLVLHLKTIHELIDLLSEFGHAIDSTVHIEAYKAYGWPLQIKFDMLETTSTLEQGKVRFQAKLEGDKIKLEADLNEYQSALEFITESMTDVEQAMEYNKKILQLKQDLSAASDTVQKLIKAEALFGVEPSNYSRIHDLTSAFEPLRELWSLAVDFKYAEYQWMNCSITKLDPNEIEAALDSWYREASKLEKLFVAAHKETQVNVTAALCKAIEAFRRRLPLIFSLCNGAFQPRHWNDLLRAMNSPLEIEEGFSFAQLLDSGIQNHMELVEEKSELAQKEFGLKSALLKMKSEWKAAELTLLPYRQTGVYVLKGFDMVYQLLEDHLTRTQSMRSSKYIKCVEHQSREWETKLLEVQQLFVSLESFQRALLYLHPIFHCKDISQQLPEEFKAFESVETCWSGIVQQAIESPGPLEIAEIDNVSHQVSESNANCNRILRALNDYLETKRLAFPRFFLLSNDELLDILMQIENPYAVQPHMNKCFEGVHSISLTGDATCLKSVRSFEGEELQLVRPVFLKENGKWKKAEAWLSEVEECLSDTVRHIIDEATKNYAVTERHTWCLEWPEQVVLTVSQLFWTTETTEAIDSSRLGVYLNKCNEQLHELVKLVRGPLTEIQRLTTTTLLTTDVHVRDVVEDLREKNVTRTTDFNWLAQLRCYWQPPDSVTLPTGAKNWKSELKLEMLHAHLFYGFEYLGNTERLVVTPLTDRCYRTLVTAYHLQYGGAPEGPAGTGKTETVKDLAKAAGRQCLVFNCSDGLDYLSIGRIFKGLTSSGAWGCFDEFNRIEVEVLSVVAQQIHSIQQAIRNQARVFVFEGTDIKLAPACAINVTMNPGYAGRSELPDNLKALFRPCAMMVPDFFFIAEVYLYSTGFANARSIARKVLGCLNLSSTQFSTEKHYDFGMRYLKAILRAAARLKHQHGDAASEDALALLAVEKTTLGKLVPTDLIVFRGIVSDLFLGVERVNKGSTLLEDHLTNAAAAKRLQPTEKFLTKCTQLWDTLQCHHGLMLLGAALSGKTAVLECLSAAMETLSKVSCDYLPCSTYSINPKSLTLEQLYGKYDASIQEWTDGIISLTTRTATQLSDNQRKWIVFDGPVDANWIENMNTVLDDNKKLCLTSGEIIKLSPLTSMIFEVEDLASVSPATVSRCGMVYLDQSVLGWKPLLQSWIQLMLMPTDTAQIQALQSIAEHAIPVFFEFVRTHCETPVQVSENWLLISMMRLYKAYIDAAECRAQSDAKRDRNVQHFTENTFLCTIVWTVGACVAEASRPKFDIFFRKFIAGDPELAGEFNIIEAPYTPRAFEHSLPSDDTVYDYFFDGSSWVPVGQRVPHLTVPNNADLHSILVPNPDSTRSILFLQVAVRGGLHVLLVGPTGTGKTKIIDFQLRRGFDRGKFTSLSVCLLAKSTANETQDIIDLKMDRHEGGVYTAAARKQCLIFLDDINLPSKDTYGSQPVIELLRQCLTAGGWYDRSTWRFKQIKCFQVLAAMGPPDRGSRGLSQRFLRHFNMIYMTPLSHRSLVVIYQTLLRRHFSTFSPEIQRTIGNVTEFLVDLHERVCAKMIPTPSKPHYAFSLRDLTRVVLGLRALSVKSAQSSTDIYKCCIHECERVYTDRLISMEDEETVGAWLREALKVNLRCSYEDLVPENQPLLFCGFVGTPRTLYQQRSLPDIQRAAEDFLQEYNKINMKRQLNLVFFVQAVQHLTRTVRILCQPCGNALLIGLGGSGRRSLTKLASFIAGHDLCTIEPKLAYGLSNWRDDLKTILVKTGCHLRDVTFMLPDAQLEKEDFLQDAASILNSGEVHSIFTVEDKIGICDILSRGANSKPTGDEYCQPSGTANSATETTEPEDLFSTFVKNCHRHLHIVFFFSPSETTFRQLLQTYPTLVKCCTMDWYNPWSKNALQDVAEAHLSTTCFGGRNHQSKLCRIIAEMHLSVSAVSVRFNQETKRFNYVTPTSYREFLRFFEEIDVKKKEMMLRQQKQLSSGLEKLESASVQTAHIREDLERLKPQLELASAETASLMSSIESMQKEAAATQAIVQAEEEICDQQATSATRVKEQCHEELQQAMPALLAAIEALQKLSKADITELNSLKSPPLGVVKVMVALCKMFSIPPVKVKSPDGFRKVEDYWTAAKKHLLSDTRLLQKLISYDRDSIPAELMNDIAPYLTDPDFNPDVIRKASVAATSLCKWVRAIIVYDRVAKGVEPKKAALQSAERALAAAAQNLENKKVELREAETLVNRLWNEQRAAQAKKDALKRQFDDCNRKLQAAEWLLRDLASERDRWMASFDALKVQSKSLLGENLLTSGVITYGGVFPSSYRQQCLSSWFQSLVEGGVPVPAKYDLQLALGEPLQIQQWICNLLPNDSASIENAIILAHSKRWPMLIDPQKQATRWLKKSSPGMKVLRVSDRRYFEQLKTAIEMGTFVFLEQCSENLDPALSPIVARDVFKTGNMNVIRLQDVNVEYAPGFKLYLATNLPNPHFTPEICAELTLLNFSVTVESLENQLLNTILQLQHPEVEAKRQVLLAESATYKQQLRALEEKILLLLSNAEGNVLDDAELLGALSSSKVAAQGISNRVSELDKIQEVLQATRTGYQPVANRGACLYAVVLDLSFVEEMYQFSAEWYIAIFTQALENARLAEDSASSPHLRLEQVEKEFLVLLYDGVCRSIFAKHKLVFSLMLAFKVMDLSGHLNSKQLQLFLKGGVTSSRSSVPKPAQADWLPDVAWDRLENLEEAGGIFENLTADLKCHSDEWKRFFSVPDPTQLDWPHSFRESASELERSLLIQALRPDCLVRCMRNLVEGRLGREFLEPPPFDLQYSYKLTTPARPLLFLLSSGADPMEEILKLAHAHRIQNKLTCVSLGQGQEQRAAAAIENAVEAGGWTLLQNCHLGSGFLRDLERIVDDLSFRSTHPDFRLLLTSMPTFNFPVSTLLNSVKITSEVTRGLRQNIQRIYRGFDSKFLNDHPKPEAWKKLLFGLSFFHALLMERRRFGPLGWNVSYDFSQNDFSISVQQLRQLLADLDPVPWDMLKYLTAEINYGGRIVDPWDRRLINCMVEDVYTPKVLEDDFRLCESDDFVVAVPSMHTVEEHLTFVGNLPNSESPEYNTLHPNADIAVAIAEGNAILMALLSSKPKSSGQERIQSFADSVDIARMIGEQLPASIGNRAAQRRNTTLFKETLYPVLLQELIRYDSLLWVIHENLEAYQAAVEGRALLTSALEEFGNSLNYNCIPRVISAAAYPSSKSLSSWVKDLSERLDFFQTWLNLGPPSVFWISAFFRPQSFLTAVLQHHAREVEVPVDEIDFDFEVLSVYANTGDELEKANSGIYINGLYMDGARWSLDEQILTEPFPRILYYEVPIIWLKPVMNSQRMSKSHVYECPVYRTPVRAGSLSTSGISSNYILAVALPIGPACEPRYWIKRGVALLAQLND